MIKIVQQLKVEVPDDTTNIRVIRSSESASIKSFGNCQVVMGDKFRDFNQLCEVLLNSGSLIPTEYTNVRKQAVSVGNLTIESYSCLPATITLVVSDLISSIKIDENESNLIVAVPLKTTETEVVMSIRDECTYFTAYKGSDDIVGNLILYNCSNQETRSEYDYHGSINPDDYEYPSIDEGRVTSEFLKYLQGVFPQMGLIRYGDENKMKSAGGSYIEYTLLAVDNWRRPYIQEVHRNTLISELRFKVDLVFRDTVEFMNLLHRVRANETLTNVGKLYVKDQNDNPWKCSMDWGTPQYDHAPGSARGNYGKNAGHNFYCECAIRCAVIPYSRDAFDRIEEIQTIIKFILQIE